MARKFFPYLVKFSFKVILFSLGVCCDHVEMRSLIVYKLSQARRSISLSLEKAEEKQTKRLFCGRFLSASYVDKKIYLFC